MFKGLYALVVLLLATPQRAAAYVDPGSGALLWQIAAAALFGCLFLVRRIATWVRSRLGTACSAIGHHRHGSPETGGIRDDNRTSLHIDAVNRMCDPTVGVHLNV
jgi:hypothetical protein